MPVPTLLKTLIGVAASIGLYWTVIRPWHSTWGADQEEAVGQLPGDELAPLPVLQSTRAITIDAPADEVWPWIVQIGQQKAGLYSYEWLENLVGCDIHNCSEVQPQWQSIQVGDSVRLGPEGYPYFTVTEVIAERALVLQAVDPKSGSPVSASWVFVLIPIDSQATRLVVRNRNQFPRSPMATIGWGLVEPAAFVMEQKMLRTIKELAESGGLQR